MFVRTESKPGTTMKAVVVRDGMEVTVDVTLQAARGALMGLAAHGKSLPDLARKRLAIITNLPTKPRTGSADSQVCRWSRGTRLALREPDNFESLVGREVPNPEAVLGHAAPVGADRETPFALERHEHVGVPR
jgi:hypothetical protein